MGLLDDKWFEAITIEKVKVPSATRLLKENGKRKKTRRGSGIQKKLRKISYKKRVMEQYRAQKRARGQMFRDFKRLIEE